MNPLSTVPIEDMIRELQSRNISFVIAYANHVEFHKNDNKEIVWSMEAGGVLPLQITLSRMLVNHIQDVEKHQRTQWCPSGDSPEDDDQEAQK